MTIWRSSVVAPEPGGPAIATREPLPKGAESSPSGLGSFSVANTAVSCSKRGRSAGGSGGWPLTESMRTSDG